MPLDMSKKSRRARHETTTVEPQPSFLARYRLLLIGAVVVAVVGVMGYVVLSSATASAYTCDSLLEGPPGQASFSLADFGDELPGFPTGDDGSEHVEGSTTYVTCPPTSGEHRAAGALQRDYYGPGSVQVPNDWVHNLEHGYAVIAYAGDPGTETLARIREVMDAAEPTEVAIACQLPNKVIALRFDEMSEPFAVLAWNRALLLAEFDRELVTSAAERFQDLPQAPERAC
jgi:hypothetical protein